MQESTPQQKKKVELQCHASLKVPKAVKSGGHALQVPLGPAEGEEQLEETIVRGQHLPGKQHIQGPGGRVLQEQGEWEGPVVSASRGRGSNDGGRTCHRYPVVVYAVSSSCNLLTWPE